MKRAPELTVSVIVCTRNRAHYLHDCLQSLSGQTCDQPFEIIVIDNGSTDRTEQLISEWQGRNPKIRTFKETRVGLSVAKNIGARLAEGRLLLFTDDDVILPACWIQAYVNLFSKIAEKKAIVGGPIVPVLNDLRPWPAWFDDQAVSDAGLLDYQAERQLRQGEYVWGANMAIPSRLFRELGPWNENLGNKGENRETFEDTEYQDRVIAAGGALWFCPAATLQHRIGYEQIKPRHIMETSFARGRNEFCRRMVFQYGALDKASSTPLVSGVFRLATSLAGWFFWTAVLRFAKSRGAFRRTRQFAFNCGENMERLRAGRKTSYFIETIVRATWLLRGYALRGTSNLAGN